MQSQDIQRNIIDFNISNYEYILKNPHLSSSQHIDETFLQEANMSKSKDNRIDSALLHSSVQNQ